MRCGWTQQGDGNSKNLNVHLSDHPWCGGYVVFYLPLLFWRYYHDYDICDKKLNLKHSTEVIKNMLTMPPVPTPHTPQGLLWFPTNLV